MSCTGCCECNLELYLYEINWYVNVYLNVDGAIHFIYSHKHTDKYDTNPAEDSSDMNQILFIA